MPHVSPGHRMYRSEYGTIPRLSTWSTAQTASLAQSTLSVWGDGEKSTTQQGVEIRFRLSNASHPRHTPRELALNARASDVLREERTS
eukprot:1461901-Rhodomonas_salina.2